jgi:hypothetical protein
MIKYFQGGYDEAKLYTVGSHKEFYPICPDCNRVKNKPMMIKTLYRTNSIGCICSDKLSYPEKFIFELLKQLDIDYIYQY